MLIQISYTRNENLCKGIMHMELKELPIRMPAQNSFSLINGIKSIYRQKSLERNRPDIFSVRFKYSSLLTMISNYLNYIN